MELTKQGNILFTNAIVRYKNFDGKSSFKNNAGNIDFTIDITEDEYLGLKELGYNPKCKDLENGQFVYTLQIKIRYDFFPPTIWMVSGNHKKMLNEKTLVSLQSADFIDASICIRPYNWDVNGKAGVTPYVKYMYANVEEDPFADMYAYAKDVDEVDAGDDFPNEY